MFQFPKVSAEYSQATGSIVFLTIERITSAVQTYFKKMSLTNFHYSSISAYTCVPEG
jgi:hypothetical protein